MRWISFFILAYVVLGIQLGAGQFLRIGNATPNLVTPNLVLIAAVFVSANAPREAGLIGALLLGFFLDLLTIQPLGLFALGCGVTGLMVMNSRQAAYGDHPLTHFMLTLGGALVMAALLYIHARFRASADMPPSDGPLGPPEVTLWPLIASAFYTACLAPPVLWLLGRTKPLMGFRASRARW